MKPTTKAILGMPYTKTPTDGPETDPDLSFIATELIPLAVPV